MCRHQCCCRLKEWCSRWTGTIVYDCRILSLSCSFSRQGIADASIALLFWLNENDQLLMANLQEKNEIKERFNFF